MVVDGVTLLVTAVLASAGSSALFVMGVVMEVVDMVVVDLEYYGYENDRK